jgi:hypothetical protein
MCPIVEIDMSRFACTALAACSALVLSLSWIGAIGAVFPAQAASLSAIATV